MKKEQGKRHTAEQIIRKLREADTMFGCWEDDRLGGAGVGGAGGNLEITSTFIDIIPLYDAGANGAYGEKGDYGSDGGVPSSSPPDGSYNPIIVSEICDDEKDNDFDYLIDCEDIEDCVCVDIYTRIYVEYEGDIVEDSIIDRSCYPLQDGSDMDDCQIKNLADFTQKKCCWGKEPCEKGNLSGKYILVSDITYPYEQKEDYTERYSIKDPLFECLDIDESCDDNEECIASNSSDEEGHCVQANSGITPVYVCRLTDPWCGDRYCDPDGSLEEGVYGETCPDATRYTDIISCDPDPECKYYICNEGCTLQNLPEGEYPRTFSEKELEGLEGYLIPDEYYPYQNTADWYCDELTVNLNEKGEVGMHCDGEGRCVTSCIDDDKDGYGLQPSNLFHAESCYLGSAEPDCKDNGTSESIDSTMNFNPYYINPGSSSPFCDCDAGTPKWREEGQGVSNGIYEGPINIQISIEEDFCFDGYDNDCDDTIDCDDLDCSPDGYLFSIRNRTCGVNEYGESDCTEDYQTEPEFDRACCPDELDCVIDGECVASGDLHGEFPDVHQCVMGQWYGSDSGRGVCNIAVNDTEYNTLDYEHWGLTGNAGDGACCGDDPNEYYRKGTYASEACCSNQNAQVIGGRCVGSLKEVQTWDKTSSGYCLDDTQCLVNPDKVDFDKTVEDATSIIHFPSNPVRCINDGEFIGDHYCRNGEWTSRTALLIRQLMDIGSSSSEYSLFCDSYKKVLNFYGYAINDWYPAVNYFQTFECKIGKGNDVVPCVNNLCVLKYGDENNVIIGASINHDVDASSYSILEALGGTNKDCSSVLDSNTFTACGGGVGVLYYNNKIKSIIYTRSEPPISDVLTGGEAAYIRNLFEPTLSYLQYVPTYVYDYGFVNETSNFNKIYIHKKGDKSIYIITEKIKNKKYMSATYTNFNTNICTMIENYKAANPVLVPFDCVKQGNVNYVFTGGLTEGYYDLLNDLGPKLRIK